VTLSDTFYLQGDSSGQAISWSGLTTEEQKVAAVLVENNLYVGADYNIYQLQYEWVAAANASTLTDIGYTRTTGDYYLFEDGTNQAIELCTVKRRNKGAYHSVYNPNGTAVFYMGASVALEENQDDHAGPSYAITAVDTTNNTFTIDGDYVSLFTVGSTFNVTGAILDTDDNSRDYMVSACELSDGDTVITVTRDITADTGAHGQINTGWPAAPFYDIIGTNTTLQTFTIAGDHTSEFPVGFKFEAIGTTDSSNDRDHTVTECTYEDGNTVIKVYDAILNTGNSGMLHSVTWFHISYCFSHISMTTDGPSGSTISGVVAASSDSANNEIAYAHDHILPDDVTDVRTYLATTERVTDPNLTLNTPVLTGVPLSAYELDSLSMSIDPYNGALTYTISAVNASTGVSVGTIVKSGSSVTWTLPEISDDTIVRLTIFSEDGSGYISQTNSYSVLVKNLEISGDEVILVGSSSWSSVSGASVSSGFLATEDGASGTTVNFVQGEGESDWGKYQVSVDRKLNAWVVDGASTVNTLILAGTSELTVGQMYAVKYAGSDTVTTSTLGVTGVSWDGATMKNTLSLSPSLPAIPEMVWSWDGTVNVAVGTELESLVPETELTVNSEASTTTQIVGSSATSGMWVNNGYHNTVKITVGGVEKTVTVLAVSEAAGVYTLQIPTQSEVPTTMVKPTCYTECTSPTSIEYASDTLTINAVYGEVPTYGNDIRKLRFAVSTAEAGTNIFTLQADLWTEA
jgi:hypothetical protein